MDSHSKRPSVRKISFSAVILVILTWLIDLPDLPVIPGIGIGSYFRIAEDRTMILVAASHRTSFDFAPIASTENLQ
jgi:hypothetical protein